MCDVVQVIFDPQSPGGTIDRASSITPGTSSDEASTLDGAIAGEGQCNANVSNDNDSLLLGLAEPSKLIVSPAVYNTFTTVPVTMLAIWVLLCLGH